MPPRLPHPALAARELAAEVLPRFERVARSTVERLKLTGLDIEVEVLGDGRARLTAPVPWLELILAELQRQATVFAEQMVKVRAEELRREGEQRAVARQARGDFEREAAEAYDAFQHLREEGVPHREALHRLRAEAGERLRQHNVTSLTVLIYQEGARRRRLAMDERERDVLALLTQGLSHKAIAAELNLTKDQVRGAIRRESGNGGERC